MIYFSSFTNPKARKWLDGRKNILNRIKEQLQPDEQRVWMHCASLGEFEQGRPVLEAIRKEYPQHKIVLTFFSPSGYEIRKNYAGADYIFYLPLDTPRNARVFIDLVDPELTIFVKYEFWYHYIHTLKKLNKPIFIISAFFRKDQVFFRWYGGLFQQLLHDITHIFVQDNQSKHLLQDHEVKNVSVVPDTRFDRVYAISQEAKSISEVEKFKKNKRLLVAGSTWEEDEEILSKFISNNTSTKYIIAPHEIDKEHIHDLEEKIDRPKILFSQIEEEPEAFAASELLIVDNIGMLSRLYKYAFIAYVGGGFGAGVHNTLEPAVYGIPVIFGPNYHKFREAEDLIHAGAAFSIKNYDELETLLYRLLNNSEVYDHAAEAAKKYIQNHLGGTDEIMKYLKPYFS